MRNFNFLFSNSVQGESDLTRYCPRDAFEMLLTCPRHLFHKMLILSMLLISIGVGNVWGTTYTWTCAKSQTLSSGANTLNGVSWNSDQSGTYQNAGTKGAPIHVIQIGTNSSAQTLNLTTSGISGTISSITVNCSSKDGKHTVVAKVGTSYTSTSKSTSGSLNDVSFTSINATGNITLTFTKGNGNLRVHSISVEYSSCTPLGTINGSISLSKGKSHGLTKTKPNTR